MIPRALLLLVLALPVVSRAEAPMTDEDVVRMSVAGNSTEEILREIGRREPGFDLSPEMLEELKRAEIADRVIEAMRERLQATRDEPPAATAAGTPPRLRIRLNPERKPNKSSYLRIRQDVDPQLAAEWELGNRPEERVFAGIALFVACVTPDHVPHQWRSKSPLGRDFISAGRHRMLLFDSSPGQAEGNRQEEIRYRLRERRTTTW